MGLTMAETIEQYLTSGKLDALSNVSSTISFAYSS